MSGFINTIDSLGDDNVLISFIDRSLVEFNDDVLTSIGESAFLGCAALSKIDLPNVRTLGNRAFYGCTSLETATFPKVDYASSEIFQGCTSLTSVNLPLLTKLYSNTFTECTSLETIDLPNVTEAHGGFYGCTGLKNVNLPNLEATKSFNTFYNCTSLETIDLPKIVQIYGSTFNNCTSLTTVILRSETMCTLSNTSAFNSTPIASGAGYIYVPSALLTTYQTATNWSTYSAQFRAIEDYTVNGTIMGALDETKI